MKKLFVLLALALCSAPPLGAAELKLVESVPEETVYGSSGTHRPQDIWVQMIRETTKTLDIEQFYIADKPGEALSPVLNAIQMAVIRGVKVRLLVDKVMMAESGKSLPALQEAGVSTRVIDFKKAGGGVQHAKFFVADGKEVYVGSQNFDWRSLKHIHELGVMIRSKKAGADFTRVFEGDWALAGGAEARKMFGKKGRMDLTAAKPEEASFNGGEVTYSLAFSPEKFIPKGADSELAQLLKQINASTRTVRGQVMTYSLEEHGSKRWAELDSAFRKAAARGVKVELVFADWAMGGKADRDIKALGKTENITIKISSLPPHSSGFIPFSRVEHLKYLVVDGENSYITTSNWGPGYFLTTRGTAVLIKGAKAGAVLEDIFSRAWNGPYATALDPLKEYRPVKRN